QEIDHSNARFDQWRIGAGYNRAIAPGTDLVARVAYQKFDPHHSRLDLDGYNAEVGLRNAFGEHVEVYAFAGYQDYTRTHGVNPDGAFYGRLGGQVKLNRNWGINGDLKMDRHGDKEWSVGPRFSW
ncbi:MAG: Ax21 family protein, partial [Stenotrophomonas nitritireducens]|nr:Ax21 family protein [Stenotrophomonas nitritireducens]